MGRGVNEPPHEGDPKYVAKLLQHAKRFYPYKFYERSEYKICRIKSCSN